MIKAVGYAAKHSFSNLHPLEFERADPKPNEVEIEVLYCGVCHSDVHQVRNDWKNTVYPCMPGHEVVGRVRSVGAAVTRHQVGDVVGVGCMIDSCRHCEPCQSGEENYCEGPNGWLATYNGPMVPAVMAPTKTNEYGKDNTYGGYSNVIVVAEDFVLKIPDGLPIEAAAPVLCAGVTTYSPLRHWGIEAGDKVGVVGLGGLGHMAVKLAVAMGATVVAFTTTREKVEEAAELGATGVYAKDKEAVEAHEKSFDLILSTIPEATDLNPFIPLLKRNRTLVVVGALAKLEVDNMEMAMHRNGVSGSIIGSLAETQEVLDFCAEHGIAPEVEVIKIQDINDAFKKVNDGEVRFRYVIDMASLAEVED